MDVKDSREAGELDHADASAASLPVVNCTWLYPEGVGDLLKRQACAFPLRRKGSTDRNLNPLVEIFV